MRDLADHPLPARGTATGPGQAGIDPGLIDEDEASRIDPGQPGTPCRPCPGDILPVLPGRPKRLCLRTKPRLLSARQIEARLRRTPLRAACGQRDSVRSPIRKRRAASEWLPSPASQAASARSRSSGEQARGIGHPQRGQSDRNCPPARRIHLPPRKPLEMQDMLTPNRNATAPALPSPPTAASTPWRRSLEQLCPDRHAIATPRLHATGRDESYHPYEVLTDVGSQE